MLDDKGGEERIKGAFGKSAVVALRAVSGEALPNGSRKWLLKRSCCDSRSLEWFGWGEAGKGHLCLLRPALCQGCPQVGPAGRQQYTGEAGVGAEAAAWRRLPVGRRWGSWSGGEKMGATLVGLLHGRLASSDWGLHDADRRAPPGTSMTQVMWRTPVRGGTTWVGRRGGDQDVNG
jgi:hypothetical protein